MAGRLEIGIAGGGVAGLAAGTMLARAGHRVVIFDRLETPAPVGSGLILQPIGLAVLKELGVEAKIRALGAPIKQLCGRSQPAGRVVLDVRYEALGKDVHGLAVHRAALFSVLHETARRADVDIVCGRTIGATLDLGPHRFIEFADGTQAGPFDLVIDALGARSILSKPGVLLAYGALWANVNWVERAEFAGDALEQRYERARKMAGVLPIGRIAADAPRQAAYFWSLKHSDFAAWRAAPLDAWKEQALTLWPETAPLIAQIKSHEDFTFATYAHRTLRRSMEIALAHVGDSWHSTSPQLGQGANMALLDALALVRALDGADDVGAALSEYARMRRLHIWLYQSASWLFTPAYQSDGVFVPWLRDAIVGPLSRVPPAPWILAALVAGQIGWPLGAMGRK